MLNGENFGRERPLQSLVCNLDDVPSSDALFNGKGFEFAEVLGEDSRGERGHESDGRDGVHIWLVVLKGLGFESLVIDCFV